MIAFSFDILDFLTTLEDSREQAKVCVDASDDELYLSLGLSDDMYEWMDSVDSKEIRLKDMPRLSNLIEDTSHFCYLAYKCTMKDIHPLYISRFEIELQGYIDIFVLQFDNVLRTGVVPKNMRDYFFNHRQINPIHPDSYKEAYYSAGALANDYCSYIEDMFLSGEKNRLISDLRRFYRKDHQGKRAHVKNLIC